MPALSCADTYFLPEGLPGFEQVKGLSVRCVPDIQPFFFMRSMAVDPTAFICIDPFVICPEYEPEVGAGDLEQLGLVSGDHAIFVALVNTGGGTGLMTANLRSPLVLNRKNRIARQIDCGHDGFPIRYPVAQLFQNRVTPTRPAAPAMEGYYAGSACASCGMQASA
jgi:flagellar assembly factor FliW